MSFISFINSTSENNDMTIKILTENFEEHFAMYLLSNINKQIKNIEVFKSESELYYLLEFDKNKYNSIINTISNYRSSHFYNTLIPNYELLGEKIKITFRIMNGE